MQNKIYIGFFKDAKGEDTIQISADVFGLVEMQRAFQSLANGHDTFNFSDLMLLDKKIRIDIVAYADTLNLGMRLTNNGKYEWRLTKAKWDEFKHELVMLLVASNYKPIHFESDSIDNGDLKVIFSLDDFNQFKMEP